MNIIIAQSKICTIELQKLLQNFYFEDWEERNTFDIKLKELDFLDFILHIITLYIDSIYSFKIYHEIDSKFFNMIKKIVNTEDIFLWDHYNYIDVGEPYAIIPPT